MSISPWEGTLRVWGLTFQGSVPFQSLSSVSYLVQVPLTLSITADSLFAHLPAHWSLFVTPKSILSACLHGPHWHARSNKKFELPYTRVPSECQIRSHFAFLFQLSYYKQMSFSWSMDDFAYYMFVFWLVILRFKITSKLSAEVLCSFPTLRRLWHAFWRTYTC